MNGSCEHYVRRCHLVAPCCNKIYTCRFCHNENETHEIDRHAVKEIVCAKCNQRQPVAAACCNNSCETVFAAYFCSVCNFFDDRIENKYYHCEQCGICRMAKGSGNFVHCNVCQTCVSTKHSCKPNRFHVNCPICLEYLFDSVKQSVEMPCGHPIHAECMINCLQQNNTSCPICRKSMIKMEKYNDEMDAIIATHPIQEDLFFAILCNDCGFKGNVKYHPFGMKCGGCSGYNTTR